MQKLIILYCIYLSVTCCINRAVINFTTQGMHLVGQDEIVILLELDASNQLPKDIFIHLNEIYHDADKGAVFVADILHILNMAANNIFFMLFRTSNHRTRLLNGKRIAIPWIKRARWFSVHTHYISMYAEHNNSGKSVLDRNFDTSMGSAMGQSVPITFNVTAWLVDQNLIASNFVESVCPNEITRLLVFQELYIDIIHRRMCPFANAIPFMPKLRRPSSIFWPISERIRIRFQRYVACTYIWRIVARMF